MLRVAAMLQHCVWLQRCGAAVRMVAVLCVADNAATQRLQCCGTATLQLALLWRYNSCCYGVVARYNVAALRVVTTL
ncbi:unnamed protein product [Sphagnum jensenii]